MKKAKLHEIVTCVLFCGFIGMMGLLYLVLPKTDFSELEKRELEAFPILNWETLTSGQFGADLETYMADHMPGRNFFVGLGAYYDLFIGQQPSKDIYLAEGDRLVETPVVWNQEQVEKNLRYIQNLSQKLGQPIDMILVPSAGFILEDQILGVHDDYTDDAIISQIYAMAGENIRCLDLAKLYLSVSDRENLYYRTDHHWTSYGAYMAYQAYMQQLGRPYASREFFTVEAHPGFRGSTYTRSALWLTPGENVELWQGSNLQVETDQGIHEGAFYLDRLKEADMYTVFLDGNQPIVRIRNEANAGKGKLLVIRDSYSNCIGPMLAESYEEVVMVDLRYYRSAVSALVAAEGFDQILLMYSIGNFMTDSNFPYLR